MKEYKCIKDFYIEDVKFASKGNIVKLSQKNTIVNINSNMIAEHIQKVLDNKEYFIEVKSTEDKKISVNDNVNHPKHYTNHPSGIECIEITRHYCFSIGNAIKYLWRAGLKTEEGMTNKQKEIEDLKKAIWYINDRIKQLEK